MKLVGKGTYQLISKPTFHYAITKIRTAEVEILAEYYYDILKEEQVTIYNDYNEILMICVIDYIDYNFDTGIIRLYMTEYIGIIAYDTDLLGVAEATPYVVTYTSETALNIINDILTDTDFTAINIPSQTISSLEGSYLNRLEWLELLNSNIKCGLDSDGYYTTTEASISSDERSTDIIVDYENNTVTFGIRGCIYNNNVWKQKTINLDEYIIDIDQYKDKVYKYQRVIVIGSNDVTGSAYISTSTDVPVKVITDDSCADADACETRAQTELNLNNSISSITLNIQSELFYSNSIEEGMLATITTPLNIAGEYVVNQIEVSGDDVSVTLGSPKKTLLSSIYDLEKRVNNLERWG